MARACLFYGSSHEWSRDRVLPTIVAAKRIMDKGLTKWRRARLWGNIARHRDSPVPVFDRFSISAQRPHPTRTQA